MLVTYFWPQTAHAIDRRRLAGFVAYIELSHRRQVFSDHHQQLPTCEAGK